MRKVLSIVLPIYNEEKCIDALWERLRLLKQRIDGYGIEFIMVNDGSSDRSLTMMKGIAERHHNVKILSFSRNFGHQVALSAGLEHARGDVVVVMDADLQDPPELIVDMLSKYQEGYDIVYAVRRERRGETSFKRKSASWFYKTLNRLSSTPIPQNTGDFRLLSRRAVDAFNRLGEKDRFLRGMLSWIGFNQVGIEYDRPPRIAGETKYPLKKMLLFALDGIVSFSNLPLRLATWLGFFTSFLALLYIVVVLIKKFLGYTLPGYASIMVSILFLGGVQLITIGILGEYISRIYNEAKGRPLYIIEETVNCNDYQHTEDEPQST
ncbi:MAG: glycosyltransferase family 2 protein [Nitrospirae bacterium]|nr:glycosyltransferase family 2 protein [Nitrospirota bacterium]MCL5237615.1 glycosyltransferase family 2 protein [Nitrospirota bacterium]